MKNIKRSALVSYSAQQMFNLVDDISSYPQFVPHCHKAEELERNESEVTAKLSVAKSGIAKDFTTRNENYCPNKIVMNLVEGPFKSLTGTWHFTALDETACKISLDLDFEFKNKIASLAFSAIFEQLAQSMVAAFCDRAKSVYGVDA